jgi:hypothetical protein
VIPTIPETGRWHLLVDVSGASVTRVLIFPQRVTSMGGPVPLLISDCASHARAAPPAYDYGVGWQDLRLSHTEYGVVLLVRVHRDAEATCLRW